MRQKSSSLLGLFIAIGLVGGAFVLGQQFKNLRQPSTITVKGLSEKPYSADLAEWHISTTTAGDTYQAAIDGLKASQPTLDAFLNQQGFDKTQRRLGPMTVEPTYEQVYNAEQQRTLSVQNGYAATQGLVITDADVQKIATAQKQALEFKAQQPQFDFAPPLYLLNNLETIKHSLIASATEDAHKRATEFAKTGQVTVGTMRTASQGSFNILSDQASQQDAESWGGEYDKSTINKLVRLVVTIEYDIR
ncbi:MAG: SIMPL domain-containing protein [Neisseriaceae bacterium]|nr:SIMPL domain-containing protein [Neisseriaceae bacterium]